MGDCPELGGCGMAVKLGVFLGQGKRNGREGFEVAKMMAEV